MAEILYPRHEFVPTVEAYGTDWRLTGYVDWGFAWTFDSHGTQLDEPHPASFLL